MASSQPFAAPPDRRVKPAVTATTSSGFIPLDAVYEILLRVTAKDLCRFRAVCRPWRSLLSDPHFIAAHADHHPGPLIVAGYKPNHGVLCDIMDLSGQVIKRVPRTRSMNELVETVEFTQQGLICTRTGTANGRNTMPVVRLLNLADGTVHAMPQGLAEEEEDRELKLWILYHKAETIVFGLVASTGEYKVLRVLAPSTSYSQPQFCEVCTLHGSSFQSQWRGKDHPTDRLLLTERVVIDGIAYFFSVVTIQFPPDQEEEEEDGLRLQIASFDLEREEWRPAVRGPPINHAVGHGAGMLEVDDYVSYGNISMAALNGSLVVSLVLVRGSLCSPMDLWFLIDFEKGLWVKQHSIQVNSSIQIVDRFYIRPLLVLNDGRIVVTYYVGANGLLRIYNPRDSTYTDVAEIGPPGGIGVYTGNLLSLANGAS